jgi:hypothetical protein
VVTIEAMGLFYRPPVSPVLGRALPPANRSVNASRAIGVGACAFLERIGNAGWGVSTLVVVDCVSLRQHPLMQDAGNENASRLTPEKHDVPALFHTAQAGANVIASSTRRRVVGQPLATRFQVVDVTQCLVFAPRTQGIGADLHQAGIGKARQTELSQWLALLGKLSGLPDAIEGVSLGNATVVAFINRRS